MKSSCRAWARLELEMGHFEENESEASNARTGQWLQQFIVPSSAQVLLALNTVVTLAKSKPSHKNVFLILGQAGVEILCPAHNGWKPRVDHLPHAPSACNGMV